MRKIRIAFQDFWEGFDINHNFIVDILLKKYIVEIITDEKDHNQVEYLFYSGFGEKHLMYNCIKIFFTGENIIPDFNMCDYAMGFEHMELGDRYIRYPLYFACYQDDYKKMMEKNNGNYGTDKKFCSFVVSQSSVANPIREYFFNKLSAYKRVDSGGRFLNNIGEPNGVNDKLSFQSNYKFSIAFENTSHPGYCTEKLVQAFAAGTIPIYWGDPRVTEYFNPKAFINCLDYSDLDTVIEKIVSLDNDEKAYQQMRMEPAIVDNTEMIENYEHKLELWLWNICGQKYTDARRVDNYGSMLLYQRKERLKATLMQKYASIELDDIGTVKERIIKILRLLKRGMY